MPEVDDGKSPMTWRDVAARAGLFRLGELGKIRNRFLDGFLIARLLSESVLAFQSWQLPLDHASDFHKLAAI